MKNVLVVVMLMVACVVANAALVSEYNASAETQKPGALGWTVWGDEGTQSTDMGNYLLVNTNNDADPMNAGDNLYWRSPVGTPMTSGVSSYGIEVKMRPVDDWISTGYSYESSNISISWSDNVSWYQISIDKDKDDAGAGTVGRIVKSKYGYDTIVDNIDWSVARTVGIGYDPANNQFNFYVDGVLGGTWTSADLALGAVHAPYRDKVIFGDSTTGGGNGTVGPDYNSEWYSVKLYSTASEVIPEPATIALLTVGGLLGLRRKK